MKPCHVAVVMGGISPEHDISLKSGATVLANLDQSLYRTMAVVIRRNGRWCTAEGAPGFDALARLDQELSPEEALVRLRSFGVNAAFLALHGPNGEDGSIQGFFQTAGIPYTGSGVESSAVCMNKNLAKIVVACGKIEVAPDLMLYRGEWEQGKEGALERIDSRLDYPLFVKSVRSGSSIGVFRAEDRRALQEALNSLFLHETEVMVEQGIAGREVTCCVLGGPHSGYEALQPVEIIPKADFFDFGSKYDPSKAQEVCPAPIGEAACGAVRQAAVDAARLLRTSGIVRADFMLENDHLWFLEMNTIPGLTPESIVLKEAEEAGIGLDSLMDRLIQSAVSEHRVALEDREAALEEGR
jgi:D-alanine-D-alanine ligase